jgi:hypothetical protein
MADRCRAYSDQEAAGDPLGEAGMASRIALNLAISMRK